MESRPVHVPSACSALEGIYLLAVLLHEQLEALARLRRMLPEHVQAQLDGSAADLGELHWRLRAILGAADPGPCRDAALLALLEMAGLRESTCREQRLPWRRGARRRAQLSMLEDGATALKTVARQCQELFAGSEFMDEFNVAGLVAVEQETALQALRSSRPDTA